MGRELEVKVTIGGELVQAYGVELMAKEAIKDAVRNLNGEIMANVRKNINWTDLARECKDEILARHKNAFFQQVDDYDAQTKEILALRMEIAMLRGDTPVTDYLRSRREEKP